MSQSEDLPRGFESWNPAMRGAYLKGRRAFDEGLALDACPYEDKRKDCGRITWSRAYRSAWGDGWRDRREQSARAAVDQYHRDRLNGAHAALAT